SARGSATVGTGLGLTICREIVDQHGGSIDVASVVGEGTTVTIRLTLLAGDRA
ncbi:MAG: ATPase, partial [Actinomycetales bacterium]